MRDPWALAAILAALPLIARAWGAPLGEPVAEDFDFLQRALFERFTLWDGGGSTAFWRPIPHQLYYLAFGRLMLSHPAVVATLHVTLLALATLLLYRAFRTVRPGPWAAVVATAPLLSESTRTMISWPSDFVDLSLWLFVALAAHEVAKRRMLTALAALLGALLCKEVAVIAAVLLPLMPGVGPRGHRERLRWLGAFGALTAAWAALYVAVRMRADLALPHDMEQTMATAAWGGRMLWSLTNSLRAIVSLALVESSRDRLVGLLLALTLLLWLAVALRGRRRGARWGPALPWALWGLAWFLGASATLTTVFPHWMPNRSAFGSLGLIALAAELAWVTHPMLLGMLVVTRLVALGIAPGPPARVTSEAPPTGAFMDFEKHVRLQMLMRASRLALLARIPSATRGMRVGEHYTPRHAQYVFGGSKALRAWYRDPTLDWVPYARFQSHPDSALAAIVEFEPDGTPQAAIVEPGAMRLYLAALQCMSDGDWAGAAARLDRAESLQLDDNARVFRGLVAGERAHALLGQSRFEEAEREARRGIQLFPPNFAGHYVLGYLALQSGRIREAGAQADSILMYAPRNPAALELQHAVRQAANPGPARR